LSPTGSATIEQATRRITATPRSTGAVSCACEKTDKNAPWFKTPRRLGGEISAKSPAGGAAPYSLASGALATVQLPANSWRKLPPFWLTSTCKNSVVSRPMASLRPANSG
jgi:hypothetical protein